MNLALFAYPAAIWVAVTSIALLLSHSWRTSIAALAIQYVGVFVLAAATWPIEMAVAKLVAGWMASAVLGIAVSEAINTTAAHWNPAEASWPASRFFRLLAASLVLLTIISVTPNLESWLAGANTAQVAGGMTLIGMGLLHLGFTAHPLRVVLGLLTMLSGFEIFYAGVETSALIAGLMAAVNLGLALTGAYLLLTPGMEPE